MSARVLLARLRRLGAQVRLEGDTLWVRPAGALSPTLRAEIAQAKPALLVFLRHRQDRPGRLRHARDRALQRVPPHARNGHPALERYLRLLQAWAAEAGAAADACTCGSPDPPVPAGPEWACPRCFGWRPPPVTEVGE